MLIGFTIVAAPLLFAIVNAAVQMNRLSNKSEQLVIHGMQGTRNNQVLFEQISALERTARLFQIIGNADLLEVYARNNERLNVAAKALIRLPVDEQSRRDLETLQGGTRQWAAAGQTLEASALPPQEDELEPPARRGRQAMRDYLEWERRLQPSV